MKGLRLLAVVGATLVLVAGCGDDKVSSPTPTPVTTPTPTPSPTPTPAPAEPAALDSISVDAASVEGQAAPTATVTLTAAAPAGGAVVTLQSGNTEVAKVPSSVTVPAGEKTATFKVDTSTVPLPVQVTLQATYLSVTKLFVLSVRSPALVARFTVTSASKGTNACSVIDSSGTNDCVFDSTASSGFIADHIWTLKVGSTETTFTGGGGNAYTPPTSCAAFQGGTIDGNGVVLMTVTLVVQDRGGNKSSAQSATVQLSPSGRCGY